MPPPKMHEHLQMMPSPGEGQKIVRSALQLVKSALFVLFSRA